MSINGVGGAASQIPVAVPAAAAASTHQAAQAASATVKTLYGSPGTAEGLANTMQRMKQLLQPAQAHIKAAHPEVQ